MTFLNPDLKISKYESHFNHFVVDNFLENDTYKKLETYHQNLLERAPLSDTPTINGFARMEVTYKRHDNAIYNTFSYPVLPLNIFPANLIHSAEVFDFVQKIFNWIPLNGDVCANIRHNPKLLDEDLIHTDYCSLLFSDKKAGKTTNPFAAKTEAPGTHLSARAVTGLLYLNNPDWNEADGAETGLYNEFHSKTPFHKIVPLNNRVLFFEVSPFSFHRFLPGKRDRNSILFIFHTDPKFQFERFKVESSMQNQYE